MYDYLVLKEYAEAGKSAEAALRCLDNVGPAAAENNWYTLGKLMHMNPATAEKKLRADAEKEKKEKYVVDGNRFHSSLIEAMMGMSIEEYCGLK